MKENQLSFAHAVCCFKAQLYVAKTVFGVCYPGEIFHAILNCLYDILVGNVSLLTLQYQKDVIFSKMI